MASKIKISEVPDKPKATYFRKSAYLTTGDSSFKFNFNLPSAVVDNGNSSNSDGNTIANNSNTILNKSIGAISNAGDTEQSTDSNNTENNDKDEAKNFKFSFTSSEFKFNFDVKK